MKTKTLILMAVAVVCGLVASYLTSRMLAQQGDSSPEEKVKVLVARQKIPMGTKITDPEKLFVEKEFTKGSEPKKAFTSFEQLKDRRLNKTLGAEVQVTPDDLMDPKQEGMAAEIPPGWRGIAIQVRLDSQVGGFVIPRSHVDIVSTVRTDTGPQSKIILQDVLVLAVDQQSQREADKSAVVASTVTLQLKPDDAEKVTLAASMGELRLVLRPDDDHEVVRTIGAKPGDVAKGPASGGNPDDPDNGPSGPISSNKIPDVPAGAPPAGAPVGKADAEPEVRTHTLTIYNGETPTKTVYVVGKNGETSTHVEKTDLDAPPRKEKDKDKDTPDSSAKSDKDAPAKDAPAKEGPEPRKDAPAAAPKQAGK